MRYIPIILLFFVSFNARSQSGQILQILPPNPSNQDSIKIISKLEYNGECSYGLVSYYEFQVADTISLFPTYCGYGLTTPCTRIDTFHLAPLQTGFHTIRIEYHQGSVCPLSGFDAKIAQKDSFIQVNSPVGMTENGAFLSVHTIQQGTDLHIEIPENSNHAAYLLELLDNTGRLLRQVQIKDNYKLSVMGLQEGIYLLSLRDQSRRIRSFKRIYLH